MHPISCQQVILTGVATVQLAGSSWYVFYSHAQQCHAGKARPAVLLCQPCMVNRRVWSNAVCGVRKLAYLRKPHASALDDKSNTCRAILLRVTRRKHHRPGIAPNANTTHVPTAGSSAAPTKPNHTPSRHSRAKGKLLPQTEAGRGGYFTSCNWCRSKSSLNSRKRMRRLDNHSNTKSASTYTSPAALTPS